MRAGFQCVATAELLDRRLEVQRVNDVCSRPDGYIQGDLGDPLVQEAVLNQVRDWRTRRHGADITVLLATPPCQGISVANHKKNRSDLARNSLVLHSLEMIKAIRPKYFIIENVRGFLNASCVDGLGEVRTVREALEDELSEEYRVVSKVLNLKDSGSPSSRTRTIVIGERCDLHGEGPESLFPSMAAAPPLQTLLAGLKSLNNMGEFAEDDHLHHFRPYKEHMRSWIHDIAPGKSAFDNVDPLKRPHRILDGVVVPNKALNGDKYTRADPAKVAPCVHTRNDILASQTTVHPWDDRVFSIRELMRFMGIPEDFKWGREELVSSPARWSEEEKRSFLKRHETNIRQCLGEGVPTPVINAIAIKMRERIHQESDSEAHLDLIRS